MAVTFPQWYPKSKLPQVLLGENFLSNSIRKSVDLLAATKLHLMWTKNASLIQVVQQVANGGTSALQSTLLDEHNALRPSILIFLNNELVANDQAWRLARRCGINPHHLDLRRLIMSGKSVANDSDGIFPKLNEIELTTYEWQMWADGIGELGQRKLKAASVLISRIGGVGGTVAYQLAAAGIGKLILAHAGDIKPSDLNRQLLMTHDRIGQKRVETAQARLHELNPRLILEVHDQNINSTNAESLISGADIVVDCAPLFEERYEMNRAAVKQAKPMVECAMYQYEASLTTILPGISPCLACLSPVAPTAWRREFPVFGAVAGTVACLAAMEVIKLITGVGETLHGTMLTMDLASMSFKRRKLNRNPNCSVCKDVASSLKNRQIT